MTNDEINDKLKLAVSIGDIGRANILRELQATNAALAQAQAEREQARADVARLTAAVGAAAALPEDWRIRREMLTLDSPYVCADELDAALRGDTAPAQGQE